VYCRGSRLPIEFQGHLQLPGTIGRVEDLAKRVRPDGGIGHVKLRVIEGVERLETVFEARSFAQAVPGRIL